MSLRSAYAIQIQICNLLLIFCGLAAVGLAGSQFSKVFLNNYKEIDLRLLNWINILSGLVGIFCVTQNHGSILSKGLYILSLCFGIGTCIFYGFTTYRIVDEYNQIMKLQNTNGFNQEYSNDIDNYVGKITISSIMIGISFIICIVNFIAIILLDKLVIVDAPLWPPQTKNEEFERKASKGALIIFGFIKLSIALPALGLCAFMEYERETLGLPNNYINIALDHIACILVIASAIVELFACFGKLQFMLNIKVAIGISVIASVWCLKSVDMGMYPFYKNDLNTYRTYQASPENSSATSTNPYYIIAACHGVLMGVFSIMFLLCISSIILSCASIPLNLYNVRKKIGRSLKIQSISLSIIYIVLSCCLITLMVLGLVELPWNGIYIGGDLLCPLMLFLATGIFFSKYFKNFVTIRFVLSICSLCIAVEKTCATANLIYQSADREIFINGKQEIYVGQIVLYSVQAFILGIISLISLLSSILYGRKIISIPDPIHENNQGLSIFFSLGTLFYGVILTGCYVVFELGYWRYDARYLDSPFFRIGNGPLALGVFVVQFICACNSKFLISTIILQTIVAGIASYTLSWAITNTYYLQIIINSSDILQNNPTSETVVEVGLILAAGASLACVIGMLCSAIVIMKSSFILHHGTESSTNVDTDIIVVGTSGSSTNNSDIQRATPAIVRPKNTTKAYWNNEDTNSRDDKRYYNQPYDMEHNENVYNSQINRENLEARGIIYEEEIYKEIPYNKQRQNSSTQTEIIS
uniref:Protein RFT1 homolog n=1 Tax=Strongyloides stercoralis TaxID=6248 RepID=A0A0K0ED12_STRER